MSEGIERAVNKLDEFCRGLKVLIGNYCADQKEVKRINKVLDEVIGAHSESEGKNRLEPLLQELLNDSVVPNDQLKLRMRHAGLDDLVEPE